MNPIRDINYLSLDLELNNLQNGTVPRIIQVGIAWGSPVRPDDIKTFSWYLDPEQEISPFIQQLTGITDEIIKEKSVSHEVVAKELGALININKCFVNPVTWGQGDADELKAEFRERNIHFPFFGRRILDVKTLYVFNQITQGKTPSGGLRKSMISYGLTFEGQSHRAEIDALNTLRFFFYFLEKQRKFEEYKELMRTLK
jgi:inhibitor of KinA sporulation pathway (predicted exonuclease)